MNQSVSQSVLKSSAILLTIQLFQKSLGFISTLILARLLVPEHFGVVALVMICLMLFENIADAGNQHYIIQKQQLDDADLHTAWSIDLLMKLAMFALILLLAPWLARFFSMPELSTALMVASLVLPIKALQNPVLMRFAKEMNYQPVFRLSLWQKLLSFVVTVGLAWWYPSHWPVIIGALVSALSFTLGSYLVSSFRPLFSLTRFRQQWDFSKWLMLRGVIGFARYQADNLIVSRRFSTADLGGYHLLRELTLLPAIAVIVPCTQPLQAAIANQRELAQRLSYRTRMSLFLLLLLLIPITAFLLTHPALIVDTLLGAQWTAYNHLLAPFALFFLTFCLFDLISNAILAIGRSKALFWFDLWSTLLVIAALLLLATGSLSEMAWLRAWLSVLTTLALLWLLHQATQLNLLRLLLLCLPYLGFAGLASLVSQQLIFAADTWLLWQLLSHALVFFGCFSLCSVVYTLLVKQRVPELAHQTEVMAQLYQKLRGAEKSA